jgi:hypothetical protein
MILIIFMILLLRIDANLFTYLLPIFVATGILGILLIDIRNNKVQSIIKKNNWKFLGILNIPLNIARLFSLILHLSLIIVPFIYIKNNGIKLSYDKNKLFISFIMIPTTLCIFYKIYIYPMKIKEVYLLKFEK